MLITGSNQKLTLRYAAEALVLLLGGIALVGCAAEGAGGTMTTIAGTDGEPFVGAPQDVPVTSPAGTVSDPLAGTSAGAPFSGPDGAGGAGGGIAGMDGLVGDPVDDAPALRAGFVNLAPPMREPYDPAGGDAVTPAAPPGWKWYDVAGAFCRDGSPNGVYVRHTDSDKLLIYFEGGGACTTKGFCHFNPPNVDSVLTGTGETVLGTVFAVGPGRQQPGGYNAGVLGGIFDESNAANPFRGWNMVYIPYCTGDVHFGTNENGSIFNVTEPQKFVGYKNNLEFIGRAVPTFQDKVDRVVVTGASAGSFGAALNFSMISDAFYPVRVDAILDSGAPFEDAHWPACMQKKWRELWSLDESLPPDCTECFQADGGGFIGLADFLMRKHPVGNVAAISSIHDEVIRLFFAPGQNNCALIDTADPFEITTSQILGGTIFPAADYEAGLLGIRAKYQATGRLSSYLFGGTVETLHQHTFRPRFYEQVVGGVSMAQFVTDFLAGTMTQVGP